MEGGGEGGVTKYKVIKAREAPSFMEAIKCPKKGEEEKVTIY